MQASIEIHTHAITKQYSPAASIYADQQRVSIISQHVQHEINAVYTQHVVANRNGERWTT